MNISKMVVTICLLYKTLFTLGALDPLMPSVYVHVALSYIPKISITVFMCGPDSFLSLFAASA